MMRKSVIVRTVLVIAAVRKQVFVPAKTATATAPAAQLKGKAKKNRLNPNLMPR